MNQSYIGLKPTSIQGEINNALEHASALCCIAQVVIGAIDKVRSRYFWPILNPSPCHTLSHIRGPPKVRHTSQTPNFSKPIGLKQKPGQNLLYKYYSLSNV